ncbi:MAG: hypothetical protein WCG21_11900 [Eubacteriales bacterium]
MQNTSTAFQAAIISGKRKLVNRAIIQTAAGVTYNLGPDKIVVGSLSVNSKSFSDGIELGTTEAALCNMSLNNDDGFWDDIDLTDATLWPYSGIVLPDTTTEDVKLGTFIVDDPGRPYRQLTLGASDRMILLDEPFSAVTRTFPATNLQILQAISTYCGVPLASSITTILNATYSVTVRPTEDMTCRDVVGMIAMMAAGRARMSRTGELEIVQYPALIRNNDINGSGTDVYVLDGLATDSLYDIGGALFTDLFGYQGTVIEMGVGSRYPGFKQTGDTVTVSGIQYNAAEGTLIVGTDNYMIVIEDCPLLQNGADAVIQSIYAVMVGFTYTGFVTDYPGNPAIDAGDAVRHITMEGNEIVSLISSHNFVHGVKSTMEATAKSAKEKRYRGALARQITTISDKAITAQSAADAAAAAINALAPLGLVEAAKLGTTIMQGGYIKAELLDVLTLIAGTLSNTATNPDCWATIGTVTLDARVQQGIFVYLRSISTTVPAYRLLIDANGAITLYDKNNVSRIFLSSDVVILANAAGVRKLEARDYPEYSGFLALGAAANTKLKFNANGSVSVDIAGVQKVVWS